MTALVDAWRVSVAAFERYGHVYEAARSRARLAAALRAAGDDAGVTRGRRAGPRGRGPPRGEAAPRRARQPCAPPTAWHGPTELTPREVEVLALLAQGLTNGQIGKQLYISTKTVSVHVSNLLAKLGASGRTEAAAIARRRGLVSPEALAVTRCDLGLGPRCPEVVQYLGVDPSTGLPAFAALVVMVIGYLVLVELGKLWFYRAAPPHAGAPSDLGHRFVRRRAARFSVAAPPASRLRPGRSRAPGPPAASGAGPA